MAGDDSWTLKLLLCGKKRQVCQPFTPGSFSSTSGDFLVIHSKFLSALWRHYKSQILLLQEDWQKHVCAVPLDKWLIQGFHFNSKWLLSSVSKFEGYWIHKQVTNHRQKILSSILVLCFSTCYIITLMNLSLKAGAADHSPLTPKSSSCLKKMQFTTKISFLPTSRHLEAISCQFCNRSAVKTSC